MSSALTEAFRFDDDWRPELTGLLAAPTIFPDLVTSSGSIGSRNSMLGESDRRSLVRYGGGETKELPLGEIEASPGSIPGSIKEGIGHVLVSAGSGLVLGLLGIEDAATPASFGAAFGSCKVSATSSLRFDISVSLDRFLW
jgi:hypothetical protein